MNEKSELARLRAASHPTRLAIMSLLTSESLTAGEVGRKLGISQANASYHMRQLAAVDLIEQVDEKPVRGGVAKVYRYFMSAEAGSSTGTRPTDPTDIAVARKLQARQLRAVLEGVAARAEHRASGTTLVGELDGWVSEADWETIVVEIAGLVRKLHDLSQPARSDGAVHISAAVQMFPLED